AGPRGDATVDRAAREILIALALRRAYDRAFDPHLPMQRIPMQYGCGPRSRCELASLARLVVREEDDIAVIDVDALAQNHARRGIAAGRGRGHDHGIRSRLDRRS